MHNKLSRKKGIVLITTMLSVVLVVMLLSAVVYSNMGSMRLTSNFYDREQALIAADSGVQYALTRLQNDITWKAEKDYEVKQGPLTVKESKGNVVGIINLSNGRRSAFRIKFNCEDGDGGLDGMSNSAHPLDMYNISVNNLNSFTDGEVYIADKDGKVEITQGKPTAKIILDKDEQYVCSYPFKIKKGTCRLAVEGLSGNGMRDLSIDKLFSMQDKPQITSASAEAYFAVDSDAIYGDSVASSGGNVSLDADKIILSKSEGSEAPNLRSLRNLKIKYKDSDSNFITGSATAYYGQNGEIEVYQDDKLKNDAIKNEQSADSSKVSALAWDDIPKATAKDASISSGTYVWTQDENGKNVLMHYGETFTDISQAGSYKGTPVNSLNGAKISLEDRAIIFNQNTYINGNLSVLNGNADQQGTRPIIGFAYEEGQSQAILTSTGNVYVQGVVLGSGALTAEGNVAIEGTSVLESNPDMGVSIYSKGDIDINSISSTTKAASDAYKEQNITPTVTAPQRGPIVKDSAPIITKTIGSASNMPEIVVFGNRIPELAPNDPRNNSAYQQRYSDIANKLLEKVQKYLGENDYYIADGAGNIKNNIERYLRNIDINHDYEVNIIDLVAGSTILPHSGHASHEFYLGFLTTLTNAVNESEKYLYNGERYTGNTLENGIILTAFGDTLPESELTPPDAPKVLDPQKGALTLAENGAMQGIQGSSFSSENKTKQLNDLILKFKKNLNYSDMDMSGVLYAQGKININLGSETLNIKGSVTSYGADPAETDPSDKGEINLTAGQLSMTYDPTYINNLMANTKRRKLKQLMHCTY